MFDTGLTGSRLRARRQAALLRQSEVAARAGISPAYLNLIEHNRRNVTPEVLARIAAALGADPGEFERRSGAGFIAELREAAASLPEAGAEADMSEDLAGRFPGWARLVSVLAGQNQALRQALAALSDRLSHDPNLSAALHELLQALSSVRSVAQILAETSDLSPDWQRRFHLNLHQDSERLSEGAQSLISWLDQAGDTADHSAAAPRDALETWLMARNWQSGPPEAAEGLSGAGAQALARDWLRTAARDEAAMPEAAFRAALAASGPDPARLAAEFGTSVLAAMRRIAFLPGSEAGLVICDASGTLLFRKAARGFSLPRLGAACPLWPLFQALGRSGQPVRALAETPPPGPGRFLCLAFCESRQPFGFEGPELREAAMLILPVSDAAATGPAIALGATCRLCPREACPARREDPILGREMLLPAGKTAAR